MTFDRTELVTQIRARAPSLPQSDVEEFCARMVDDYFRLFSLDAAAAHATLSSNLSAQRPVAVGIDARAEGGQRVTIVAYDYFGEFAVLCGLISSFGLDIQAGHVFTFAPEGTPSAAPRPRAGPRAASRRPATKIVDVFDVRATTARPFDAARQEAFASELGVLVDLLSRGAHDQARDRVNLRLVEALEQTRVPFAGVLLPVEVRFDNEASERWTIMDVHAQDTPAFLYTFANALALRGVYVHRVEIGSVGGEAQDRFFIADRLSGKIVDEERQATLRLAVGLIKQFTHFLSNAPDPAYALRSFDQLFDTIVQASEQGRGLALFTQRDNLAALAQLLGSSHFLWEDFLRMQLPNLLPIIEALRSEELPRDREGFRQALAAKLGEARTHEERKRTLNEFKDRMMFLIDLKQLLDARFDLVGFSLALASLAETVLEAAIAACDAPLRARHGAPSLAGGEECGFVACGLGKFGGRELGYASDIELLFVYSGSGKTSGPESIENGAYFDALVCAIVEFVESRQNGIFEIDLRLRPYGRKGPMASALDRMEEYYRDGGEAAPFERQALVKLRSLAGDADLARAVEALRDRFVYSAAPFDLAEARHLRRRQIRELVKPGEINVKHSAGGLIDVEYGVQYLQVQHGQRWMELRTPNTLEALEHLAARGLVPQPEADSVAQAYRFLRRLIDGLRMVRGHAKDLVLPAPRTDELRFLARRLAYSGASWDEAAEHLLSDVTAQMNVARAFYRRHCGDPDFDAN